MVDPEQDKSTPETPSEAGSEPAPEPRLPAEEAAAPEREEAPAEVAGAEAAAAPEVGAAPTEAVPVPEPEPIAEPVVPERAYGTGRRKTSVARVYLRPGTGKVHVNGRSLEQVFPSPAWREHARGPLVFAGVADQFDARVSVKGGGGNGQAGAVRQGLARALARANPELRTKLRRAGFLTRDARMKERKKYGQKGARKRFQWTKR